MFLGPSQNIWDNATFASLGISDSDGNVAPNIYRWTWGSAADQSFTINVVSAPEIPLPAALPLFATGIGGLGLLGWRRKRRARAAA
jgi:hypothetical protein